MSNEEFVMRDSKRTLKTFPDGYTVRTTRRGTGFWNLFTPDGELLLYDRYGHWSFALSCGRRRPFLGYRSWVKQSRYGLRRQRLVLWAALFIATNAANWLFLGATPSRLAVIPVLAFLGAMTGKSIVRFQRERKKVKNGSNRRTEADHSDPQAQRASGDGTVTFNSGGVTFNSGTVTFNSGGVTHTVPTFSSGVPSSELPGLAGLETVKEEMPILAHRYANIVPVKNGIAFKSVTDYGGVFGVDAEARCNRHSRDQYLQYLQSIQGQIMLGRYDAPAHLDQHSAPAEDCTCGFHAVPADLLPKHANYGGASLLVELSGKVIEHTEGYRAEHQRVIQATTPPCATCGAPPVKAWRTSEALIWDCGEHEIAPIQWFASALPVMALTLDQISTALGVPVLQEAK